MALVDRTAAGKPTYRAVNSCLALMPMLAGREVVTVEGLARGDQLHPVQAAMGALGGYGMGQAGLGMLGGAARGMNALPAVERMFAPAGMLGGLGAMYRQNGALQVNWARDDGSARTRTSATAANLVDGTTTGTPGSSAFTTVR